MFSYETDKASFDEEAPVDGILLDVFFEEGDDVPCLLNVCVIGQEGESTEEFRPKSEEEETAVQEEDTGKVTSEDVAADVSQATEVQTAETAAVTQPMDAADVKISPRARNLAEKLGVDIRYASPTGPYGRIIEQDVVALRDSGHMLTPAAQAAAASGMASGITAPDWAAVTTRSEGTCGCRRNNYSPARPVFRRLAGT